MYREYAPPPPLAPYVSCFWDSTPRPAPQRVLPDGAMDTTFYGTRETVVIDPEGGVIIFAEKQAAKK